MKHGLGIIGFGGIGGHHFRNLAKDERLDIIGIYDIDPHRCDVAAEEGLSVFDSVQALLNSDKIDIVLVSTPNNFHRDYAIMALQAGKNVICEKPVTMNSGELLEIEQVAKQTGKAFIVHQNRRVDKDFLMAKKAMDDGLLGNVYCIESRVQGARGIPEGWRQYKVAGGGMLLDWGVHMLDQLMMMSDKRVVRVYSTQHSLRYKDIDAYFKLILTFEDGMTAHIEVGTCSYIALPRWYIEGDNGTLIIDDWDCNGRVIRAKDTVENWEEEIVYTKAGPTKTMAPRRKDTTEEIKLPEPDNDYTLFYKKFINHIEGTEPLAVTISEVMRVMQIMEATFESWKTGDAIKVNI